jgi:DNA-binding CsgD family transcriptional regulator
VDATVKGHVTHLTLSQPLDWYPWLHIVFRCEALAHAGRFHDAEALAVERYQQGLASHSIEQQAWFAWHLEKTVGARGHVQTAARYGREAVALFRQLDRPQMEHWCLTYLALALALTGRPEEAGEALAAMDALALPPTFYMGVDDLQARAWVKVAAGDLPGARAELEEAADIGERVGDLVGAAAALHGLARLGHAAEVHERLAGLAAEIEGGLAAAYAAHSQALVGGDAAGLESVSVAFESMGADLLAAEAAADAAVASRRAGASRHAAAAERRAAEVAARCEGASTPALRAPGARAQLTPAELETANMATGGRTNREIADQLGVSVRTVESRLLHVYQKLGVDGRPGLAAALTSGSGQPSQG